MVSHRWFGPAHPDPDNEKLAKVQAFVDGHSEVDSVWMDRLCVPPSHGRPPRRAEEEHYFSGTLHDINMLFLGLQVCVCDVYNLFRKVSLSVLCRFDPVVGSKSVNHRPSGAGGPRQPVQWTLLAVRRVWVVFPSGHSSGVGWREVRPHPTHLTRLCGRKYRHGKGGKFFLGTAVAPRFRSGSHRPIAVA